MTGRLNYFPLLLPLALSLILLGCGEEPGPAEKAGKKIDRALHKATDKVKELSK